MATHPAITLAVPEPRLVTAEPGYAYWRNVWRRVYRDKVTTGVILILCGIVVMSIAAPSRSRVQSSGFTASVSM